MAARWMLARSTRRIMRPRRAFEAFAPPAPLPVVLECRLEYDFDDPRKAEDVAVCFASMGSWIEEDYERNPWDPVQRTYYAMSECDVFRERYMRMLRRVRDSRQKKL
jgi:hypothetical protein